MQHKQFSNYHKKACKTARLRMLYSLLILAQFALNVDKMGVLLHKHSAKFKGSNILWA